MKFRKSDIAQLVETIVAKKLQENTEMKMHARVALAIQDLVLKIKEEGEKNGIALDPRDLNRFAQDVSRDATILLNVSRLKR